MRNDEQKQTKHIYKTPYTVPIMIQPFLPTVWARTNQTGLTAPSPTVLSFVEPVRQGHTFMILLGIWR